MAADVNLDHLPDICLTDFFTVKLFFLLPFYTIFFGRKVSMYCLHLRSGGLCSTYLWEGYLRNLLELHPHGVFVSCLHLFIYSITYMHNPTWLYLFSCSNCSSFGHWETSHLVPVFLWHSPIIPWFFSVHFYSLALQDAPGSLYIPCTSPIFPRSRVIFNTTLNSR